MKLWSSTPNLVGARGNAAMFGLLRAAFTCLLSGLGGGQWA